MRLKAWRLTLYFCAIWALTLLYGEMFAFWVPSLRSCSWPDLPVSTSSQRNGDGHNGESVKVAVIADPQLTDRTSLPLAPNSLALELVQFYSDLYMRRAFLRSILPFQPDVILYLGDYFDGGLMLSNKEWEESLSRFKHIFYGDIRERLSEMKVYYIPGNHDIGYAAHIAHKPEVIKRYEQEFGARNHKFTVGKVDFVAIDAQTIDGISGGSLASQTWDFVKNVSNDAGSNSRVLLTHIPLYRSDRTWCGHHRSSAVVNQRISRAAYNKEIIYQNYLTERSSDQLMDMIRPVLVLSGHDHDQCSVIHNTKRGHTEEHTVGTVSWQQGNLFPSFMLLSVSNVSHPTTGTADVISTQLCFLPNQTLIYIWYLILCAVTIMVLLLWPSQGIDLEHHLSTCGGAMKGLIGESGILFRSGTKEKTDEDENCEYEMVWDAEGCMHLVKKPVKTYSKDMGVVERGDGAILRPYKRQVNQQVDQELAINKGDEGNNMSENYSRTHITKGIRAKMVIQRLLRTGGMVSVIALVNVPLYMSLLFKDWIDQ